MERPQGRLDGLVLFRFGLMLRSGGGIEEHLRHVDRVLLERNRMTIVRAYLVERGREHSVTTERLGKGLLVWVPIELLETQEREGSVDPSALLNLLLPGMRGRIGTLLSRAIGWVIWALPLLKKHSMRYYCRGAGSLVGKLHRQYGFHLAVLHTLTSLDDARVIDELVQHNVPFVVIHHFENKRLAHPMVRLMIRRAAAIGGVSTVGIPRALRRRITHIGDGVDSDFFRLENASSVEIPHGDRVIFMPARIERSKGQIDAVQALSLVVAQKGIEATLAFAGRISSEDALRDLTAAIAHLHDPGRVLLLGNLDQVALRNWYAACDVVVLPSYSEGLPRTLLEAQLMKRPVVAYNVGGVSQAMVDGLTGFLVEKGDVSGLAARIGQLLLDEQMRIRFGESGHSFVVRQFNLQRAAESHEDIYLLALGQYRSYRGNQTPTNWRSRRD